MSKTKVFLKNSFVSLIGVHVVKTQQKYCDSSAMEQPRASSITPSCLTPRQQGVKHLEPELHITVSH